MLGPFWNASGTRYAGLMVGPSTVPVTGGITLPRGGPLLNASHTRYAGLLLGPAPLQLPSGMYLRTTPSWAIRRDPDYTIRRDPAWAAPIVGILFRPGMSAAEEQKVWQGLSFALSAPRR